MEKLLAKIEKLDKVRLAFASVCAFLAMASSSYLYLNRDYFLSFGWERAHGELVLVEEKDLLRAARDYAEAGLVDQVCVERWLGRDDRYLYLALGCGAFRQYLGAVHVSGDLEFRPTRLRYSGSKVSDLEQPLPGAFENGLRRLFPQRAAQRFRELASSREYRERGLARMEEKGYRTLGK